LFRFRTPQKVVTVGNVKIGGNPGENPPLLVGTIFYHGHKIVVDEKTGDFNRDEAEKLIRTVEELSSKTGLPAAYDVVGTTPEALVKRLEFVAGLTKAPILVDPVGSIEAAKAALEFASSAGLRDRVIYNSITAKSKDEEYSILQSTGVKTAIALLYTDNIVSVSSRMQALEAIASKASRYGVENLIVDAFVIDVPSLAAAMQTCIEVKRRFGYPCGSGAHNAVSTQRKAFKDRFGREGLKASELASSIASLVVSPDIILYGPIESAVEVFPAAYVIYTAYRYMVRVKQFVEL